MEFWALFAVALVVVGLGVHLVLRSGAANGLRIVALSFALLLLVVAVRTGWHATFLNGDVPGEMLVYAQDSREVPGIMAQIREVAESTGEGDQMRLTVDKDVYWGLVWYIGSMSMLTTPTCAPSTASRRAPLFWPATATRTGCPDTWETTAPARSSCTCGGLRKGTSRAARPGEPCLGLGEAASSLIDRGKWREFLDFYVYRKTDIEYLSHRAIAYFPKEAQER